MARASLRPVSTGASSVEFCIPSKNARNRWCWYNSIPSNLAGYNVLNATTLTTVTVITENVVTANFSIQDGSGQLILINLVAGNFKATTGLTINLSYQDEIKVYMDSAMGVNFPRVILGF